jgi:hypothetical protein
MLEMNGVYINNVSNIDSLIYESQQRLHWFIYGYGIHGLSPTLFFNLSTERLCELYNIEIEYFKNSQNNKN